MMTDNRYKFGRPKESPYLADSAKGSNNPYKGRTRKKELHKKAIAKASRRRNR